MSTALTLFSSDAVESQLAKANILIKSGMLSKAYDKPESVLVACSIGAELGFSPMQALQVINVIDGKPTVGLNGMLALCTKHGGELVVDEHTDTVCRLTVTRVGRVSSHTESYTMGDAAKAGLAGKANWAKMPKQMLFARAAAAAIRRVFADVLSGLYSTEEMQDSTSDSEPKVAPPRPRKVEVAPEVVVQTISAHVVAFTPSTVIDIPFDEPELPAPIVTAKPTAKPAAERDVHAENYVETDATHNAILDAAMAKHGLGPDKRARVVSWVVQKQFKVGEIDLELARKGTRKESAA